MIPIRNDSVMAISSLAASFGVHKLLLGVGEGLGPVLFPGVGVGSKDIKATSRSQTCATIRQITAKLPVTRRQKKTRGLLMNDIITVNLIFLKI